MIKYFPKITGFWKYTQDQDKHLFNKNWKELGAEIYFDLVDWCSNVWEHKAAQEQTKRTYREIGVVALAIASEVRAAALKYYDALDQFKSTERSMASGEKVLAILQRRASQDALKRLTVLEAEGDVLAERIARIRAIGEARATLAELHSTMGTNYNEPLMVK
jgi:outer membrane protein TolC